MHDIKISSLFLFLSILVLTILSKSKLLASTLIKESFYKSNLKHNCICKKVVEMSILRKRYLP